MNVFVARQPVFKIDKTIFGYEILFRKGFENTFPDIDGDIATSTVLSNTFFSLDIKEILGNKPGFINFTKKMILQKTPLLFSPAHIIVEILEDIDPDRSVIDAVKAIKKKGFTIVLDDFIYHKRFKPMMDLCSIIKFDIIATPLETLGDIVFNIKQEYDITFLAEKVETYDEFEQAKEIGFSLFQGYFFSKPEILSGREISPVQTTKLKLISEINHTELNLKAVEDLIRKDVSLSFKLLKFINSAYFKRPTPINTIKDAITYLGVDELKKFINIATVSDLNADKPNELVRSAMIRARMCELCGTCLKTSFSTEELFTLGLFSHMDAMLDLPMEKILETITLSDKIKAALSRKDMEFKEIIHLVSDFERGDWLKSLDTILSGFPIEDKLPEFYLDAIRMVNTFFK
ncbi:MAG: HDOD domain-containing protein [Desulfobacterales bacterium]|nr:HDOD domain-containing protein [Desulfobacterales bacterium]